MFHQNQNLIVHAGFITNAHAESILTSNEQITFGYWFWHGGLLVVISYVLIAWGTAVFIKHLFSILKKDQNNPGVI